MSNSHDTKFFRSVIPTYKVSHSNSDSSIPTLQPGLPSVKYLLQCLSNKLSHNKTRVHDGNDG